jgi:Arginase/agmatinase/formimionoglutamate hydrolase, arginase family
MMREKPECYVVDKKYPEIYSGTPTFLGLPKIKDKQDLVNYDVAFMGVPWEGICTYGGASGCELAPKTIRASSLRYGGYLPELDLDIFDYLSGGDYGDVSTDVMDIEKTFVNIEHKMNDILHANVFPVSFGGDHSIAYPLMKALAEKHHGKIGIIHLDAHLDNLDTYGTSKYARCSPLHRAYEFDGIDPKNIIHVGIRGPRNNPKGMKAAKEYGASVLSSFEFKEKGIDYAVTKALEIAKDGTEAVYVTLCSDVFDVAHNPGGPADFCGLSSYEVAKFLYGVSSAGVDAFDFVEIYPPADRNNVSSHLCCWMTLYVLSGLVKHRFNI